MQPLLGVKKALFSDDPFSLQPLSNTPCGLALQCYACSARIRLFPSQVHFPWVNTMSSLNHKPRRSRTLRLELLEPRELLSGVGNPAYRAAEVSPLARAHLDTLKGSLKQSPSPVTPFTSTPAPTPTTPVLPPPHRRETIKGFLSGQGSVTPLTNSKGTAFFYSSGTRIRKQDSFPNQ